MERIKKYVNILCLVVFAVFWLTACVSEKGNEETDKEDDSNNAATEWQTKDVQTKDAEIKDVTEQNTAGTENNKYLDMEEMMDQLERLLRYTSSATEMGCIWLNDQYYEGMIYRYGVSENGLLGEQILKASNNKEVFSEMLNAGYFVQEVELGAAAGLYPSANGETSFLYEEEKAYAFWDIRQERIVFIETQEEIGGRVLFFANYDVRIVPLDEEVREVSTIITSNTGKKAELYRADGSTFYSLKITQEDNQVQEYNLADTFFTALYGFEWLDEKRIVIEGRHSSGNANVYVVYDLESNTFEEYNGLYFTWDRAHETMYYVEPAPRWDWDEEAPDRILDQNGNVYFETSGTQELVNSLGVDMRGKHIGFFVKNEGETDFLIIDCETLAMIHREENVSYQKAEFIVP